MKLLILILMLTISLFCYSQEEEKKNDYSISTYTEEGFKAPDTHYIGET